MRMAITQDEGTLTPYTYQTGYPGYELMTLIYEQLFLMDEDLTPQPWPAASLDIHDDLHYRLVLRECVQWQDGTPFTADDVAFSIGYYQTHVLGRFTTSANKVVEVEVTGDLEVTLTLGAPDAGFVQTGLADLPMLPRHVWESVDEPRTMAEAMGTGPYRLVEYQAEQFYRLEANADYGGPDPAFDTLIAAVIRDETATFQALQAGEIDVAVRPVPAGAVALAYGGRLLFVVAAVALAVSVVLLFGLRARLDASVAAARHGGAEQTDGVSDAAPERGWAELVSGTRWLWRDPLMRFGLALELVASIGWAWILVNSVVLVRASLGLDEFAYGVVMAAFGLGATLFALWLASRGSSLRPRLTMTIGAIAITVAVLPADMMGIAPLAALWFLAGAGSNAVNLPMFTLMAERTPHARHGRVYGAHFAWSQLWWLAAYPLAGWLGSAMPNASYAVGGGVAAVVLVIVLVTLAPTSGRGEVARADTLEHGA